MFYDFSLGTFSTRCIELHSPHLLARRDVTTDTRAIFLENIVPVFKFLISNVSRTQTQTEYLTPNLLTISILRGFFKLLPVGTPQITKRRAISHSCRNRTSAIFNGNVERKNHTNLVRPYEIAPGLGMLYIQLVDISLRWSNINHTQ